ncbi:MAG: selenium-binding protein SBP56-related protein [Gammaproteobacteria bacterium]
MLISVAVLVALHGGSTRADETCMSPYMAKIIGQEDYVYVWTLGQQGLGDEQDKLVAIAANPASKDYGKVIATLSVGRRNEAHHGGFTDDRAYLWAGGLDTSKVFVFDVHSDPARPQLVKTITDFVARSGGVVGPHTFYAMPGRMLITGLSNDKDHGGRTAMVEYANAGNYLASYWMPTDEDLRGAKKAGQHADGYGYDVRALPRLNVLVSSSFTGWSNYMMDLGKLLQDKAAMQRFGNTVVVWDLHERRPKSVLEVPGAPLELRCAWQPNHNYCFTSTALTSKIWLIHLDAKGAWRAEAVADVGDPAKVPLPVDISLTSEDDYLWVDSFMDGTVRRYDVRDPFHPKPVYEKRIGAQLNMVSQSWDGKRLYFTSSLLANWDKKGADNEQFLKAYDWDGKALRARFELDFTAEKLGRPHIMLLGARSLYADSGSGAVAAHD